MAKDILIVDDEADIRELVAGILEDEGYETRLAGTAREALDAVEQRRPTMAILDIWLQGSDMDGLEVLERLKAIHPELPVIVISGHGNIETAVAAIKHGAYDYLEKPFNADRLIIQVKRAIEAAVLKRENAELRQRAGGDLDLVGRSPAMNGVRQAIERVAPTNSRVLVSGPPGAGKELVARMLHLRSRRADGPFVVLNAASMAPERMEAELFGIEEGAPGAETGRRVGTFEQAHGGTLFIDEVADMPKETQAKILRVLVDQTFERVGGRARVQVDVRVVSATARDLGSEIEQGRFREDLFHRLNVVPLRVPSLAERREDIPGLVDYFMGREAEAQGLLGRRVAEDAMAALQTADWPGNVRELRNLVARLIILAPGDPNTPIRSDMLPVDISNSAPAISRAGGNEEIMALSLRDARRIFEREYLTAQITRFGGNISKTAAFVGMERSALHRKLNALGVNTLDKAPQRA
ncbi:MAG: sigma-54 dependent transcriptional regulator [Sneathiellaceae bacterium]